MPDIKTILKKEDFGQVISDLLVDTIEYRTPAEYKSEYNGGRTRRKTSVGFRQSKRLEVYSDTLVDKNDNPIRLDDKVVDVARVITNFPKKSVRTATSFLFGGKMNISADDPNAGFNEFKRVWERKLKMQSVIKQFTRKVLSETKAAIIFYPYTSIRWDGKTSSELKCKLLCLPEKENALYEFYPHFNDDEDMDGFIHHYQIVAEDNRVCDKVKIWTREQIISGTQTGVGWEKKENPNPFGLIPVVYAELNAPIWDEVAPIMDAREMRLSRMADTNDYFAEPILKTIDVADLPGKNTVGKELSFTTKVDEDGKAYHGDAEFLSWQQSIDSVKKELEETRNEQFAGTSTPDLSFDNLKGIGNVSGVARRFMVLDAEIKASEDMEVFGPALQRCVSVICAGIGNITQIKYKQQLAENWINVSFESILPRDPVEDANILSIANGGNPFNSRETIVANSPLTPAGNVEDELARMDADDKRESEQYSQIGKTATETFGDD
jgi:hypothetical protein